MNWTTELPTKPGWYWWRKYPNWPVGIVHVTELQIVPIAETGKALGFDGWEVKYHGGQYAGPIPEPTDTPRTYVGDGNPLPPGVWLMSGNEDYAAVSRGDDRPTWKGVKYTFVGPVPEEEGK